MVMSVIVAMKVFAVPLIMTGGGPADSTRVLPLFIYQTAFEFFKMGRAAAMSVFLFAAVMIFTLFQIRLFARGRTRMGQRSRRQWGFKYPLLIAVAFIGLLPYYWMVSCSFKTNDTMFAVPLQWIPDPVNWSAYGTPGARRTSPAIS